MIRLLRRLFTQKPQVEFKFLDAETVRARLKVLEGDIVDRLAELKNRAKNIPKLRYLVFEVAADQAFDGFPVSIWTFDANKEGLECDLEGEQFLDDCEFLDPRLSYPLGRHDWIGIDTTEDYQLVIQEVVAFFQKFWLAGSIASELPVTLVGPPNYDYEDGDEFDVREFVNIASGERETHRFTFAD